MAQAINYSVSDRTGGLSKPVRCYSMSGCSSVVLVEDRFARQAYDAGTITNCATPQEILQLCLELPNRKLVSEVLITSYAAGDRPVIEDFHHISSFEPGRIIFFYPPSNPQLLREHLYHEWAHVVHQCYDVESHLFGLSCILEGVKTAVTPVGETSTDENWSLSLGGAVLGDNEREFLEFTRRVPISAMVLGQALSKALATAYDEQSTLAELFSRRAEFLTKSVPSRALTEITQFVYSQDKTVFDAAVVLLLEFGSADQLSSLDRHQLLDLSDKPIGNRHLEKLRALSHLTSLNLGNTYVMGNGLASLEHLQSLQALDLQGTKIRNSDLRYLRSLKALRELNLSNTQIDDAVVADAQRLTGLSKLNLSGNRLQQSTIDSIKEKLPNCQIS